MMKDNLQTEVKTLAQLLKLRSIHTPDKVLYTFTESGNDCPTTVTYKQLSAAAEAIASTLLTIAKPGERALMLYASHKDFIYAFFGCLYAGIIAVPVKPIQNKKSDLTNLINIAKNAGTNLVLTTEKFSNTLAENTDLSGYLSHTTFLCSDTVIINNHRFNVNNNGESIAFLQYTSGSTGTPKGVIVTNNNIMHNQMLINASFNTHETDVMVSWLPFYHDMGLIGGILQPLYMGGSAIFMSPMEFLQRPLRWLEMISHYKATISGGPNFAYDLCIKRVTDEQMQALDLSSWRLAFNGAEKVRAETITKFTEKFSSAGFKKHYFYPTYGLAEGTLFATGGADVEEPVFINVNKEHLDNHFISLSDNEKQTIALVSSGKANLDQEVIVVDPNTHTQCKEGSVGEIWLKGPSVTAGYWKNPEETERCYQAHLSNKSGPYFRTGDLGFYHNKSLFVTGRIKDLIIINGRNIYPDDLEFAAQYKINGLKIGNGAAFSCDINNKECVVLVQEIDREKIKHLDQSIYSEIIKVLNTEFSISPEVICFIMPHTLPKTTSGKVRRSTTKQQFLLGKLVEIDCWFANKAAEAAILAIRDNLNQKIPEVA